MGSDRNVIILSVGDRVFPGSYQKHSAFENAINFFKDGALVSLVRAGVGRGPVNIVINGELPRTVRTLKVSSDGIDLGGERLFFPEKAIYDSSLPPQTISSERIRGNLPLLKDVLLRHSPPLSLTVLIDPGREEYFRTGFEKEYLARIRSASGLILDHLPAAARWEDLKKLEEGVKKIKGLGFGLTPGGDDFIAGLLLAYNLIERIDGVVRSDLRGRIAERACSRNPLSAAFLGLARDGFFFESLRDLAIGLAGSDPKAVRTASRRLIKRGATSGADLAAGFLLALKKLLSRDQQDRLISSPV